MEFLGTLNDETPIPKSSQTIGRLGMGVESFGVPPNKKTITNQKGCQTWDAANLKLQKNGNVPSDMCLPDLLACFQDAHPSPCRR